jgi:hypothetical protein
MAVDNRLFRYGLCSNFEEQFNHENLAKVGGKCNALRRISCSETLMQKVHTPSLTPSHS